MSQVRKGRHVWRLQPIPGVPYWGFHGAVPPGPSDDNVLGLCLISMLNVSHILQKLHTAFYITACLLLFVAPPDICYLRNEFLSRPDISPRDSERISQPLRFWLMAFAHLVEYRAPSRTIPSMRYQPGHRPDRDECKGLHAWLVRKKGAREL